MLMQYTTCLYYIILTVTLNIGNNITLWSDLYLSTCVFRSLFKYIVHSISKHRGLNIIIK